MAKKAAKKKTARRKKATAAEFSQATIDTLAARSALICNHCGCLTVGPSDARGDLKLKLGEGAHIRAKSSTGPRYDARMTNAQRSDISNTIWLCASCHTMVDKNKGVDFPASLLEEWKTTHEGVISSLLRTHRSPLPMLRRLTDEGAIAQDAVDVLEQHGALFVDMVHEVDQHVKHSIERLRDELKDMPRRVKYDDALKTVLKQLAKLPQEFMNKTGKFPVNIPAELQALRADVGVILLRLREEFGCKIHGDLNRIIPLR